MGRPKAINTEVHASGARQQWVYERDGGDAYVYFENGRVKSFTQHTAVAGNFAARWTNGRRARGTRARRESAG